MPSTTAITAAATAVAGSHHLPVVELVGLVVRRRGLRAGRFNHNAQKFVDDVLQNGEYSVERGRAAGVYQDLHSFRLPDTGKGVRFTMDGAFVGFV